MRSSSTWMGWCGRAPGGCVPRLADGGDRQPVGAEFSAALGTEILAEYSRVIGSKKARLAEELAAMFRRLGFIAPANRVLATPGGPPVTDADLGVYDARDGLLVLLNSSG